jgi:hypothetical protein
LKAFQFPCASCRNRIFANPTITFYPVHFSATLNFRRAYVNRT